MRQLAIKYTRVTQSIKTEYIILRLQLKTKTKLAVQRVSPLAQVVLGRRLEHWDRASPNIYSTENTIPSGVYAILFPPQTKRKF